MRRRFLVWFLILALLTGCSPASSSQTTPSPTTEDNSTDASDVSKAPLEISIANWDLDQSLMGDEVQRYIEDLFNIQLKPVPITLQNYEHVLQQLAATENLPDIFFNDILGTSAYDIWVEQRKILPLPENLDPYPHLKQLLNQPYIEQFRREDGKLYSIPRLTYSKEEYWALDRCIMVRKDWMETLGLIAPSTWEEFSEMLHAFVFNDPDGNGLDDTQGLTATHPNLFEAVYLNLYPALSNTERGWIYEDQRWIPAYYSKDTGKALATVQKLYQEGLLDHEFAYMPMDQAIDDFIDGKVGALCAQHNKALIRFAERGQKENAFDTIMVLPTWPAMDGNTYRFTTTLHWSEIYFGNNVTQEKMERILELYDWLLSDKAYQLWRYGIPEVDWHWEDDEIVLTEENPISPPLKYPSLSTFYHWVSWRQDDQYFDVDANKNYVGEENILYAQDLLEWFSDNTQRVDYNFDITFLSLPYKNQLIKNNKVQEEMIKVIIGPEDAQTAWEKVIAELEEITPLEEAIAEVTQEAQRLGISP